MITIAIEHPVQASLDLLHRRHTEAMHAETPPESIHMLPADALAAPEIRFYVMREDGTAFGMGAFKRLDSQHAELKSMHVLHEWRGRGMSRRLLEHLVSEAKAQGYQRLSLETGVERGFEAARVLYARSGFTECPPFGDYRLDPNSVFMTREI